jgi:hypothetical protein
VLLAWITWLLVAVVVAVQLLLQTGVVVEVAQAVLEQVLLMR